MRDELLVFVRDFDNVLFPGQKKKKKNAKKQTVIPFETNVSKVIM